MASLSEIAYLVARYEPIRKREQNLYEMYLPGIPNFQNEEENRENLLTLLAKPKARNSLKFEYERKKRMLDLY